METPGRCEENTKVEAKRRGICNDQERIQRTIIRLCPRTPTSRDAIQEVGSTDAICRVKPVPIERAPNIYRRGENARRHSKVTILPSHFRLQLSCCLGSVGYWGHSEPLSQPPNPSSVPRGKGFDRRQIRTQVFG